MADKFLSRSDEKQRTLSMSLARFESKAGSRAAVATAELTRITLFWSAQDGAWRRWTRTHERLAVRAAAPATVSHLKWSSRIGLAVTTRRLHMVYKRPVANRNANGLLIDSFEFDDATENFRKLDGQGPVEVPLADLGYASAGFSLWVDGYEDEILIVAQLFPAPPPSPIGPPDHHHLPGFPGLAPLYAKLVLLRAGGSSNLADPLSWKVTVLDEVAGQDVGFDFDARREGDQLGVVERRRAAMYTINFFLQIDNPFPQINLTDDPENPSGSPLLRDMAESLVLVEIDLATDAISIDDQLPPAEHPQLQSLTPMVITGDRLRRASITIGGGTIDPQTFGARRAFMLRQSEGWALGFLPDMPTLQSPTSLPWNLQDLASAQMLFRFALPPIAGRQVALDMASLMGLSPIVLIAVVPGEKTTGFTFLHARPAFDAVSATRFEVGNSDKKTLLITAGGFSLVDINHAEIAPPTDDVPPENEQFEPFEIRKKFKHDDGFDVMGPADTTNRIGGLLVAHPQNPSTFFGFVDMGDGGGRIIFDSDLPFPPTNYPPDKKSLEQEMLPEEAGSGRAFIKLNSSGFLPIRLRTYSTVLSQSNGPTSIVAGIQPNLDGLASGVAYLLGITGLPGGQITFDGDGLPLQVTVNEDAVGNIESQLTAPDSSSSADFRSDRNQPFAIRMRYRPSPLFAGRTITFTAIVPSPPPGTLTYTWTFSDGTSLTGETVSATFSPPAGVTPRLPLQLTITLTVSAASAGTVTTSTMTRSETVQASQWAEIWTPIDGINYSDTDDDDVIDAASDFQLRAVVLRLSRYRLTFTSDANLEPQSLQVDYLDEHDGDYRFVGSSGQGEIVERMPVTFSSEDVIVNGDLRDMVTVKSVSGRFIISRNFTAGTLTSDVRQRGGTVETVESQGTPLASALCCKPIGRPTVTVDEDSLQVDVRLADSARNAIWLAAAMVAAGFALLVLIILAPLLIFIFPAAVATLLLAQGLSAIVSALVALGLAAIFTEIIAPIVLRGIGKEQLLAALQIESTLDGLAQIGLHTDAGEGLAEDIACRAMRQAREDGHTVAAPSEDGRNRMRPQLFETIIVTEDTARLRINVGRG